MDNLFGLFLFLIFVLGPILEQLKKKEQEKQRQQRPPEPPQPVQRTETVQRSTTEEISAKPRDAAAAMIPDDLWQILTGEARPAPQVPAPQRQLPLPSPSKKRPWDVVYIPPEEIGEEEAASREDVSVEVRRSSREAVAREHAARHKPVEAMSLEITQPNIVSLETPLPTAAARHTAFHKKLDAKPVAAAAPPPRKQALGLATRSDLQRAFMLQEILGKPRGLE